MNVKLSIVLFFVILFIIGTLNYVHASLVPNNSSNKLNDTLVRSLNRHLVGFRPLSPHRLFSLSQALSPLSGDTSNSNYHDSWLPNASPRLSFMYHTHAKIQHLWKDQFKGGWIRFDHDFGEQNWVDQEDAIRWESFWIGEHSQMPSQNQKQQNDRKRNTQMNIESLNQQLTGTINNNDAHDLDPWKFASENFHHIVRMKVDHLKNLNGNIFGMVWAIELPMECESVSILNQDFIYSKGMKNKEPLWLKLSCQDKKDLDYYIRLNIHSEKSSHGEFHATGTVLPKEQLWKYHEVFQRNMIMEYNRILQSMDLEKKKTPSKTIGSLDDKVQRNSNVVLLQYLVHPKIQTSADIEMLFFSSKSIKDHDILNEDDLSQLNKYVDQLWELKQFDLLKKKKIEQFDKKFDLIFPVKSSLGDKYLNLGRYALSNMMGTLGYFYGESKHLSGIDKETGRENIVNSGPYSLLSGVPCRTKFPRGFLWDEGFHQLLIRKWDSELSKSVLSHWFSLVDKNGWIPREQILGEEARSFVPPEFVAQNPEHANPPTLFFSLEKFIDEILNSQPKVSISIEGEQSTTITMDSNLHTELNPEAKILDNQSTLHPDFDFIQLIYPNIQKHYNWFLKSQEGQIQGSYRWRGRQTNHTLSSGLDDYPRGTFEPLSSERHLDLYCWIYMMTRTMEKFATFLGRSQESNIYKERKLEMEYNFDKFHFSKDLNWYSDFVSQDLKNNYTTSDGYSKHLGYVSLFPIISGLINIKHPNFKSGLKLIRSRSVGVWSSYGLRSLSINDSLYGEAENYWRGPIWININFLVLRALKDNLIDSQNFNKTELFNQTKNVYQNLRKNLISTVSKGYDQKLTLHEQYDGEKGFPKGTSPFTGWTSLILIIMSESF